MRWCNSSLGKAINLFYGFINFDKRKSSCDLVMAFPVPHPPTHRKAILFQVTLGEKRKRIKEANRGRRQQKTQRRMKWEDAELGRGAD